MIHSDRIYINDDWKYAAFYKDEMLSEVYSEADMETVLLPHANTLLPYHYFNEADYQFVCCYRRKIMPESLWSGKKVLLTFEGAAHVATIYVNESLAATHECGYTAFTVDISPYLHADQTNHLVVVLDSRECNNIPPFGNVIDYLTYGGLYREVYLQIKNEQYLQDVFPITRNVSSEEKTLSIETTLNVLKDGLTLQYRLYSAEEKLLLQSGPINIENLTTHTELTVIGAENWDLGNPQLYFLETQLFNEIGCIDTKITRFGFRECVFKADGFYLNSKKIKLVGLNRHQSYPYVGYAMPESQQRNDARILKHTLGLNCVRTSHYPQSQHFIDCCDEIGLLVFTEIPGWQHIGDEQWQEVSCATVAEMVLQYRHHPSIILWGVRINESQDNDSFYTKTNRIAHELDKTRQTGGVRFIKKSHLHEDVYTYNDFVHNGTTSGLENKRSVTSKINAPYLVTEYNGHMFPAKRFDSEQHRQTHALRHATVLDALFAKEDIAGAIGWCMSDYNTHKDFGSGDRVCYHGVLDMFRIPKLAAAVYQSQSDHQPVFELSSTMDIGDHASSSIEEVVAFTNADSIALYKNDILVKVFTPDEKKYPNLPHPPIIIDDFVGDLISQNERFSPTVANKIKSVLRAVARYGQNDLPLRYKLAMAWVMLTQKLTFTEGTELFNKYMGNWGGTATLYRFEAIKNNRVVGIIQKEPMKAAFLRIQPDTLVLNEGATYDVARVVVTAVDQTGNLLPYYQESIHCACSGCIELIGSDIVSLKGGAIGIYVKSIGKTGFAKLTIGQVDLGTQEFIFTVNTIQ